MRINASVFAFACVLYYLCVRERRPAETAHPHGRTRSAAVLVATAIAVAVLARLLRRLFRFAGFGIPDILLGIAVAVLKYLLLLSVAFAALESLNADYGLVNRETVVSSRWFGPVRGLSDRLLPFLDWVGDRIPA